MLLILPSFVSLSYFSLAVPMRECLGKHSCMSSCHCLIFHGSVAFLLLPRPQVGDLTHAWVTTPSCWGSNSCVGYHALMLRTPLMRGLPRPHVGDVTHAWVTTPSCWGSNSCVGYHALILRTSLMRGLPRPHVGDLTHARVTAPSCWGPNSCVGYHALMLGT